MGRGRLVGGLALLLLTLAACGGPGRLDRAEAGRTTTYRPDLPVFDLEAEPILVAGSPALVIRMGVDQASLVGRRTGQGIVASLRLSVRVLGERNRRPIALRVFEDTLRAEEAPVPTPYALYVDTLRVSVGTWNVEAELEDANTGQQDGRRLRIVVPAASEGGRLAAITLSAGAEVLGWHLSAPADTIVARASLFHVGEGQRLHWTLERLRSDTTAGDVLGLSNPSLGTLGQRCVDLDVAPYTYSTSEALSTVAWQQHAVRLPLEHEGVYRLRASLLGPDSVTVVDRYERWFFVPPSGFPASTQPEDVLAPLVYLATRSEWGDLARPASPAEQMARFDAFWGYLIGDRRQAADLMRRYYTRVEEANRRFTTCKAGWKTDRGLVYVLLGAPSYTEQHANEEIWYYTTDLSAEQNTFVFERADPLTNNPFLVTWVLQRTQRQDPRLRQAAQRWRDGSPG